MKKINGLGAILGGLALAGAALAFAEEDEAAATNAPPASPPSTTTTSTREQAEEPQSEEEAPSPDVFIPSEAISEDLSVAFPVDI